MHCWRTVPRLPRGSLAPRSLYTWEGDGAKAETPVDSPKKEPEETAEESKREGAGGLEFVVPAGASTLCGTTTGSEMDRTRSSVLCL